MFRRDFLKLCPQLQDVDQGDLHLFDKYTRRVKAPFANECLRVRIVNALAEVDVPL